VYVEHSCARAPSCDSLLDDLVGLLRQVGVRLLAVDPARQGAGDDHRIVAADVIHSHLGLLTQVFISRTTAALVFFP